jgi:hypothetical protein
MARLRGSTTMTEMRLTGTIGISLAEARLDDPLLLILKPFCSRSS